MLLIADRLPWAALVVIVARDVAPVVGTRFVLPRGYEFSVSFLGKAATWVLYAGIGFVLVTARGTTWPLVALLDRPRAWPSAPASLYVASAWRAIEADAWSDRT